MKVGALRKMVSAKRKIACPPVSKLPKAGLLGELAAYEAEGKARDAAKEHGPVTMKGKAKKEIVVRTKRVRMSKEEREAKMAAAKAEKEAAKEARKAESAAGYARYLEGQAKQKEATKEEKAKAKAAAKAAAKAEKVAAKGAVKAQKAADKVDTIQHIVDVPVSKAPKKGKKAAAKPVKKRVFSESTLNARASDKIYRAERKAKRIAFEDNLEKILAANARARGEVPAVTTPYTAKDRAKARQAHYAALSPEEKAAVNAAGQARIAKINAAKAAKVPVAKAPKGKVAAAVAAIEEKKKRPLTAYQEYIKANVGKGKMTMTEAAAAYQAQK
jgi:hypothetical protein